MEAIISLSKIVKAQKLSKIDVFGPNENPELLVNQLFNGITSGQIDSEEAACLHLYGEDENSVSKMRAVKKRLEEKLINTIFFIDSDRFSRTDFDKKQLRSYISFTAIKILKHQNQLDLSTKLAVKLLSKAIATDMIDLAYLLNQDLMQYYSILNYKRSLSKYHLDLDVKLSALFNAEMKARRLFIYFASFINQNKTYFADEIDPDIIVELQELSKKLESIKTYDFNYFIRNAMYFKAWLEKDLEKMELLAKAAVVYFREKKGFSNLGLFSFVQKLGFVLERKQNYSEAIKIYEQALSLDMLEGGTSWYNIRSHLFDSHLRLKDYSSCFKYASQAVQHKSFRKLFSNYKEPWIIREAYLRFLIEIGKLDIQLSEESKHMPFSLAKFANEVNQFSKDKRGLNIAIIIVQALFLLFRNQSDKFERKIETLGQYAFRYLKNDETLRSNAFIKILQKLPEVNYHPVRWKAHTSRLYKKMMNASQNPHINSIEREIIPYEDLIELIIEQLSEQKSNRNQRIKAS